MNAKQVNQLVKLLQKLSPEQIPHVLAFLMNRLR